jgi:hypothetical protein
LLEAMFSRPQVILSKGYTFSWSWSGPPKGIAILVPGVASTQGSHQSVCFRSEGTFVIRVAASRSDSVLLHDSIRVHARVLPKATLVQNPIYHFHQADIFEGRTLPIVAEAVVLGESERYDPWILNVRSLKGLEGDEFLYVSPLNPPVGDSIQIGIRGSARPGRKTIEIQLQQSDLQSKPTELQLEVRRYSAVAAIVGIGWRYLSIGLNIFVSSRLGVEQRVFYRSKTISDLSTRFLTRVHWTWFIGSHLNFGLTAVVGDFSEDDSDSSVGTGLGCLFRSRLSSRFGLDVGIEYIRVLDSGQSLLEPRIGLTCDINLLQNPEPQTLK